MIIDCKTNFTIDEEAVQRGFRPCGPRIPLTYDAMGRETIDAVTKQLGIDSLAFAKAAMQMAIEQFQKNPLPFMQETSRVQRSLAERLMHDARENERRQKNLTPTDTIPATMDDVECAETVINPQAR